MPYQSTKKIPDKNSIQSTRPHPGARSRILRRRNLPNPARFQKAIASQGPHGNIVADPRTRRVRVALVQIRARLNARGKLVHIDAQHVVARVVGFAAHIELRLEHWLRVECRQRFTFGRGLHGGC